MKRVVVVALAFVSGCQSAPDLIVDMRTDMVCGVEFHSVEVSVDGAAPTVVWPSPRSDFLDGVRLVDVESLAPGSHQVEVTLRLGSEVVAERSLLVDLVQSRAVTAVFTRSCIDVECPGDRGDATRETCLGGTCVGGACTPETPAFCTALCTVDSECAATQACSRGLCRDGVCLVEDSGSCGPDLFCHPESGCQPIGASGCPPLTQAGDGFCIDIFQQGSMTWTDASAFCRSRGGDLCSETQWRSACEDPASVLDSATDDWEWTDDVADDVGGKSGAGGCDARSGHEIFVDSYGVRCCVPPL